MEIFQIKTNKNLKNSIVDLSGKVIYSYPTKGGFWLNIQDKTGGIFVFSKENYRQNELLKIKGTVTPDNKGGVYVYGYRILKVFQPREAFVPKGMPVKETKKVVKINKNMLIIGLILLILMAGLSFYFSNKEKKTEIQSFLESVNKDFTKTLNSCMKTENTEERDKCLYRTAPYAAKTNLSLAIDICKSISSSSEINKCLNFLSLYMIKKDIDLSIDVCNTIEDIPSRDRCILGLVPELAQKDIDRALLLCEQFDAVSKDNCFYEIALSQIDFETRKAYCERIVSPDIKDNCLKSFSINESINTTMT